MKKILRKRVFRDLKNNFFRYFALFLLIFMGMYLVVGIVGAAETIIKNVNEMALKNHEEDGEFNVFLPLTDEQLSKIAKQKVTLEEMFYLDYLLNDNSTIRLYKNREQINLIAIDEGRMADKLKEAVIEKRYGEEHNLSLGDKLEIGGKTFTIVGIGTVPDYDAVLKNMSDSSIDSNRFGLVFVTAEQYEELKSQKGYVKTEEYVYSYLLDNRMTDGELKDNLREITGDTLTSFVKAEDNTRIKASAGDVIINRMAGLTAGVIIMVLFTYVISVFVIHGIEKESSIIGTLYALGMKKKELVNHYLRVPIIITFLGGMAGTILGFSKYGIGLQLKDSFSYYSIPKMNYVYPLYLFLYGMVMPPAVSIVVNYFVISKKLSRPALKMITKEQKGRGISKISLGNMGFIRRFQIRQLLREIRTGLTVVFGMFIALLILILGLDCYALCLNISVKNKADTKYNYMYVYKYIEGQVPEGGEGCYAKNLTKSMYGYNLDITVLGIDKDNPYFDVDTIKGENKIVVASSTAQKYNLKTGDEFVLRDDVEDKEYVFTVAGISHYSVGLYVFMDIDSMRELFEQSKDYYNVVLSKDELNVDSEKLYSITTKEDISKGADIFIDKMKSLIITMIIISIIIFCMVMYLMMKVMIDRSAFSIALVKIFGFRKGEIRRLYLNGNFFLVAIGGLVAIPLAKWILDAIYPYFVANVACGLDLAFSRALMLSIYMGILVCYLFINQILAGRLEKMVPAEVLKNRE